jgi:hypothetical protein
LQHSENALIIESQKRLSPDGTTQGSSWMIAFFSLIEQSARTECALLVCIILFLASDSLIAFKSALMYCLGSYLFVMIKVMYQSPRPFWTSTAIDTYQGYCMFDFASPSTHIFNVVFFLNYNIFMYFQKYSSVPNKPLVGCLYCLNAIYLILLSYGMHVFGLLYFYQSAISFLFSFLYLVLCIAFDSEIL